MARKIDWERITQDARRLRDEGYVLRSLTEYHWHVTLPGSNRLCNVWPTTRKYMENGAHQAGFYTDILRAMEYVFQEDKPDKHAANSVAELRAGGLDAIKARLGKKAQQ